MRGSSEALARHGSVMDIIPAMLVVVLAITACSVGCGSALDEQSARVVEVLDGDTVRIESGESVQLLGVGCPESNQPGGREATGYTASLVEGQSVRLESDATDRDRYGRLLRYVYVGDTFVNLEIIENGFGIAKKSPPAPDFPAHRMELESAERTARERSAGLWSRGYLESQVDH